MDIQDVRASTENFNDPNSSCSAEIGKTDETKSILRFIQQDASIRSLIERHNVSKFHISTAELEAFVSPIELEDDCASILAAIRLKMSYMRKYMGEYVPCNTLSTAENPTGAPMSTSLPCGDLGHLGTLSTAENLTYVPMSTSLPCGDVGHLDTLSTAENPTDVPTSTSLPCGHVGHLHMNPDRRLQEPIPYYYSYLFFQTLARPLTYSIFMKQIFTVLMRVYDKLSTDFQGILESIPIDRLPVSEQLRDPLLHARREVTDICVSLKNIIDEFVRIFSECETIRRHFVEVILDGMPLRVHNFQRERLMYDCLEHLVGCLENLVNQNISTLNGYSNEICKLSLYLRA